MDLEHREAAFEEVEGDQFIRDDDVQEIIADDGGTPVEDEDETRDVIEDEFTPNDHEVLWEGNFTGLFPNHRKSVFAISTHPSEPLAVSGGEDDLGYIWNITDGEVNVTLTGHTDSVSSTAFSSDGEMVATGGMDGKVRFWRRVGRDDWKTWEFLTELQGPDEVMVRNPCLRLPSMH
jgi:ribosome assembly protein SQT1